MKCYLGQSNARRGLGLRIISLCHVTINQAKEHVLDITYVCIEFRIILI